MTIFSAVCICQWFPTQSPRVPWHLRSWRSVKSSANEGCSIQPHVAHFRFCTIIQSRTDLMELTWRRSLLYIFPVWRKWYVNLILTHHYILISLQQCERYFQQPITIESVIALLWNSFICQLDVSKMATSIENLIQVRREAELEILDLQNEFWNRPQKIIIFGISSLHSILIWSHLSM